MHSAIFVRAGRLGLGSRHSRSPLGWMCESMGKILLLAALVLGAALYFPESRPVVMDMLAPVLNPVFRWQTNEELSSIVRELQKIQREGRQPLPLPGEEFEAWMGRNFQGGESLDSWGNPYTMRIWRDSVGVVSRGPDLEIQTPDDIGVAMRVPRDVRRRR